jgi:putative FmdB family regulatory protein
MPTYEYECKSCGYTFDVFQSMSDAPLKTCPQCGKDLRRLINGGTGVIFRGSGFYVTDKKGGSKSSAPSDSSKTKTPVDKEAKTEGAADTSKAPKEAASKTHEGAEKKAAG